MSNDQGFFNCYVLHLRNNFNCTSHKEGDSPSAAARQSLSAVDSLLFNRAIFRFLGGQWNGRMWENALSTVSRYRNDVIS
jgi:hypothetical protein